MLMYKNYLLVKILIVSPERAIDTPTTVVDALSSGGSHKKLARNAYQKSAKCAVTSIIFWYGFFVSIVHVAFVDALRVLSQ